MSHQATNIAKSRKSDEWTTPTNIIGLVTEFYGSAIDLDPATTNDNPTKAIYFTTKEEDGLSHKWFGNVWLNPPFSLISDFITKILVERDTYNQCIILTKLDARTSWHATLMRQADAICIVKGYTRFGNSENAALFTTQLTYFGYKPNTFCHFFKKLGYTFEL